MNINITSALFTLRIQYDYCMSILKLNVKMAPLMSIFIEGLLSYRNEFRIIKDVFNKAFLAFMSDGVFLSLPSRLETTTKKIEYFK